MQCPARLSDWVLGIELRFLCFAVSILLTELAQMSLFIEFVGRLLTSRSLSVWFSSYCFHHRGAWKKMRSSINGLARVASRSRHLANVRSNTTI